ncbi:MAG: glutamine amidotransferase [Glaciecola sp.]
MNITTENILEVLIIHTGSANTASVMAAFERLNACPRLSEKPEDVLAATHVVLPGVGSFGAASQRLESSGMGSALAQRIRAGRATLAICLGMQLFCDSSEEGAGVKGLGLVPGRIKRFPAGRPIPHMGWNQVVPKDSNLIESGYAYFANEYCLGQIPQGWGGACTDYGGSFVSALERGPVLACQFHPELSGDWGARLLQRWLAAGVEVTSC